MTDPGYWESLKRSGLFIYLFLFLVLSSIGVLTYLFARLSKYQLWNSPLWRELKVPLIIVAVVVLFASVIAYAKHEARVESRLAREYAEQKGWQFTEHDTLQLKPLAAAILDNLNFDVRNIRSNVFDGRSLYLFDCSYVSKEAARQERTSRGTVGMIRSRRFPSQMSPVEIIGRDWTEMLLPDGVDMGASTFSDKFLVLSKDADGARRWINEDIQAILLQHRDNAMYNPVSVTLGPEGTVILTSRTYDPERLDDLIDLAVRIEQKMRSSPHP